MFYLYIVQCRDGTLYTGTARDMDARIKLHNSGKGARYTRGRQPVTLLFSEEFETPGDALRREQEIKKWPRSRKWLLIQQKH